MVRKGPRQAQLRRRVQGPASLLRAQSQLSLGQIPLYRARITLSLDTRLLSVFAQLKLLHARYRASEAKQTRSPATSWGKAREKPTVSRAPLPVLSTRSILFLKVLQQLLEPRLVPQRIPPRLQTKQGWRQAVRRGEQVLDSVNGKIVLSQHDVDFSDH